MNPLFLLFFYLSHINLLNFHQRHSFLKSLAYQRSWWMSHSWLKNWYFLKFSLVYLIYLWRDTVGNKTIFFPINFWQKITMRFFLIYCCQSWILEVNLFNKTNLLGWGLSFLIPFKFHWHCWTIIIDLIVWLFSC